MTNGGVQALAPAAKADGRKATAMKTSQAEDEQVEVAGGTKRHPRGETHRNSPRIMQSDMFSFYPNWFIFFVTPWGLSTGLPDNLISHVPLPLSSAFSGPQVPNQYVRC